MPLVGVFEPKNMLIFSKNSVMYILLLNASIFFYEIVRINVELNFALNLLLG